MTEPISSYIIPIVILSFLTILSETCAESIFADRDRVKKAWKESNLFMKITNLYIIKYEGVMLIPCIASIVTWHLLNIISIVSLFLYPKSIFLLDKMGVLYLTLIVLNLIIFFFVPKYKELKIKKPREKGKLLTKEEKRKRMEKKKERKKNKRRN